MDKDYIKQATNDPEHPVVIFALEWCEFCWSLRKMLDQLNLPYFTINLDDDAHREGNLGRQIRNALTAQTGSPTIPQVFIGGQFIGGCTEVFDAFNDGSLQASLDKHQVPYNHDTKLDPYTFLPSWVQTR